MHGHLCLLAPERLKNASRGGPLLRSILITLSQWFTIHDLVNNVLGSANEALLFTMQILLFCYPRPQVEGDPSINNSGTNTFLVRSKLEVKILNCLRHIPYLHNVFSEEGPQRGEKDPEHGGRHGMPHIIIYCTPIKHWNN